MGKTVKLTVYLLPVQKRAVEELAARDGESLAAVVRRLIRREAEVRGVWPGEREAAGCRS